MDSTYLKKIGYLIDKDEATIEVLCPLCGFLNSYEHRHPRKAKCMAAHCSKCHEPFAIVFDQVRCLGCMSNKHFVCFDPGRKSLATRIIFFQKHEDVL